jgi:hypothetical protein
MSLVDLANDNTQIEWWFGFDDDDQSSLEYCQREILPELDRRGSVYTVMQFQRLGYGRLNEYVNALARDATGDWLIFWNDDAVMRTQDWDVVIRSHTGKFVIQAFDTHKKHPYSIFPIVPREWRDELGLLSHHPLNDAWISQIAWILDIMVRIDVVVDHERFDLTGKNGDDTYKERQIYEGNVNDPRDFNHISNRRVRLDAANRLARYMAKRKDCDLTHWNEVAQGRRDPWSKMLESDVNNQMMRIV